MLVIRTKRTVGWVLIAGAVGSAATTLPVQLKLWLVLPFLAGVLLVLSAHAARRGGWDQVSTLGSLVGGLLIFAVLGIVGLAWLGFTTNGFAD